MVVIVNDQPAFVYTDDTSQNRVDETAKQRHKPVAWICQNAVGHRFLRFKKPDDIYKPIALYAEVQK